MDDYKFGMPGREDDDYDERHILSQLQVCTLCVIMIGILALVSEGSD